MRLHELINNLPLTLTLGSGDAELTGITDDSRRVQPGALFIARPGADGDALRFLSAALHAGASAVLLPTMDHTQLDRLTIAGGVAVVLADQDTAVDQRLCGRVAERFYDSPSARLKLIGVTGTNGKTTTVTIAKHLLESAGQRCGLIGTVELDTGSEQGPRPATLTTPGAIELSALLAEMVANGCSCCVMEVSSHALHQGRADALRFSAAGFTNLTQDHLDYHGTMDAYADAKAVLFEGLDEAAVAVLNADDRWSGRMARGCQASIIETRLDAGRCCVKPIRLAAGTSQAEFVGPWGAFEATLPTPGEHNLSNALQAAALAFAAGGLNTEQLKQGLESCHPVPGRLEPVGADWPERARREGLPIVVVDYAHTPDALENVGRVMSSVTTGRLITVFGCGGDRDRAKRPLMAKAAQQYADVLVLTSDNPRTEDPRQILDDASAGFDADNETHILADRGEAIRFAINLAGAGDTVLIAGKGHEDYQILGKTKHHFDDREQAAAALREKTAQA